MTITQSDAAGLVRGDGDVGGLVGRVEGFEGGTSIITQSYATGSVIGSGSSVGGLAGNAHAYNNGSWNITQSYAAGAVNGSSQVGGLVGYAGTFGGGTSDVSQSYATGAVTAVSNNNAGGLVGIYYTDNGNSNITKSYATGSVVGNRNVGGLIGYAFASNNGTFNLTQSYSTGVVTGSHDYVGGLVGFANARSQSVLNLTQSYANGAVTGEFIVGGLVGDARAIDATLNVTQSYATGAVTGDFYVGGLTGVQSGVTFVASFWDKESTGSNIAYDDGLLVTGATGLTTAQFQDSRGFMALASAQGWDFETVWAPPSAGYYPELYALSPVVWVKAEDASRTYGGANPTFAELGRYGGPSTYVFGPAGDTLGFNSNLTTAANAQSNVGTYAITGTNSVISTNGVAYRVVYTGDLIVNRAVLTITASDASKTYGEVASLSGFTSSALQNGETIGSVTLASTGAAAAASVAGGPYAIVASSASGGGTFDANNYAITYVDGSLTVSRAALTITASDASKTYGQVASLSGFTSSALQNGETIGSVTLTSTGAAAMASVAGGPYAIVASNASGGTFDANNYAISYVDGDLTVNRAALTYIASPAERSQHATNPPLTGTVSGFANGEDMSVLSGTLAWTTDADANSLPGQFAINGGGLSSDNYVFVQAASNATALTIRSSAPASPAPRFVETQGPDDWAIADRFDRLLLLLSGDGSELDQCADRDGEASNCAAWPHPANLPLGHGLRISAG